FFFFQAEDGIRDFHVTGVQTCALPISCLGSSSVSARTISLSISAGFVTLLNRERKKASCSKSLQATAARQVSIAMARKPRCVDRSEERRVGKEGRCRWPSGSDTNTRGV